MGKHAIRRNTAAINRANPEQRIFDGDTVDTMRYGSQNSDAETAACSRKGSDTVDTVAQIGETSKSPPGSYRIAPIPRGEKIRYGETRMVPEAALVTLKRRIRDLRNEVIVKDQRLAAAEAERDALKLAFGVVLNGNVKDKDEGDKEPHGGGG